MSATADTGNSNHQARKRVKTSPVSDVEEDTTLLSSSAASQLSWSLDWENGSTVENCTVHPKSESGVVTLLGPSTKKLAFEYQQRSNCMNEEEEEDTDYDGNKKYCHASDFDDEVHTILSVVNIFHKLGYVCPAAEVPSDYKFKSQNNENSKDYDNNEDGDKYLTRRAFSYHTEDFSTWYDKKFEFFASSNTDGVNANNNSNAVARITLQGNKPIWLVIRIEALPGSIKENTELITKLEQLLEGNLGFVIVRVAHEKKKRVFLKEEHNMGDEQESLVDCVKSSDGVFLEKKNNERQQSLHVEIESGDNGNIDNLGSMFTLSMKKKEKNTRVNNTSNNNDDDEKSIIIGRALCSYHNGEMGIGGPTLELIEIKKQYQKSGYGSCLLKHIENYYSTSVFGSKFRDITDLCKLNISCHHTIANIKEISTNFFQCKHKYYNDDGMNEELSKKLLQPPTTATTTGTNSSWGNNSNKGKQQKQDDVGYYSSASSE